MLMMIHFHMLGIGFFKCYYLYTPWSTNNYLKPFIFIVFNVWALPQPYKWRGRFQGLVRLKPRPLENKDEITVTKLSGVEIGESEDESGEIGRDVDEKNAMNDSPVDFLDSLWFLNKSQGNLIYDGDKVETEGENLSIEDKIGFVKPAE